MENSFAQLKSATEIMAKQRLEKREADHAALKDSSVPIPDPVVTDLCQLNPNDARDVLRDHPGHDAYEARASYRACRRLFDRAMQDVFDALQEFDSAAQETEFFDRIRRNEWEALVVRVQKELFAVASAAHALVNHSRQLKKKVQIAEYEECLKKEVLADGMHAFVTKLRVIQHHVYMFNPDPWMVQHFNESARLVTGFELKTDMLLHLDGWNGEARRFLQNANKRVDLGQVLHDYSDRINRFHTWFARNVDANATTELFDFDRCLREITKAASRQ